MASASKLSKRLACICCSKAKRKCTKQTPACRRCAEKDLVCRYPAPRPPPDYDLIYSGDGHCTIVPNGDKADDGSDSSGLPINAPRGRPLASSLFQSQHLDKPWFLSPSSWNIDHRDVLNARIYFGDGALIDFMDKVRGWLGQWTSEGRTPFIHANLYEAVLPEPIQDAFTALTAYQSKTEATQRVVLYIVEQRADRLLEQQSLYDGDAALIILDTLAHLARTQALLIYSIICLLDGDIRARCHAESYIETLTTWAKQLWESAGLCIASSHSGKGSEPENISENALIPGLNTDGTIPSAWQAWLFSESIRRTYITATLVTAAYLTLKQGWAPCPGGITFTPGTGLWEAKSPYSWWGQLKNSPVGPLQCVRAHEVFTTNVPSDFDEFTHAILIVSFGLEQVTQWQDKVALESVVS